MAIALILDLAFGEPPARLHPVVGIGRIVSFLERRAPPSSPRGALVYGGGLTIATIAMAVGASALLERIVARLPLLPRLFVGAVLLKPVFAVRELVQATRQVRRLIEVGDVVSARHAVRSLVSRDPTELDTPLIAAAAIESIAENASDSVVAPCLAFLTTGLPCAYAYRAANTLDAMIGYHGRYEFLGKVAARLDDGLNLIPARLTAHLLIVGAALGGADWRRALLTAWREHCKTASPNAGWPMSAMAGALGVQLEKIGHYRLGAPLRPVAAQDIALAERIVIRGIGAGFAGLVAIAVLSRGKNQGGEP